MTPPDPHPTDVPVPPPPNGEVDGHPPHHGDDEAGRRGTRGPAGHPVRPPRVGPSLPLGPLASLVDGALVVMERRIRLLGADLDAERAWLERRAWMSALAGVAWLHALALVTVMGVAAAWDTWRLGAIATACALWSGMGCAMALWLRISARTKRPFLAATRHELQRDRQALRRRLRG